MRWEISNCRGWGVEQNQRTSARSISRLRRAPSRGWILLAPLLCAVALAIGVSPLVGVAIWTLAALIHDARRRPAAEHGREARSSSLLLFVVHHSSHAGSPTVSPAPSTEYFRRVSLLAHNPEYSVVQRS